MRRLIRGLSLSFALLMATPASATLVRAVPLRALAGVAINNANERDRPRINLRIVTSTFRRDDYTCSDGPRSTRLW